jgi:hypothetical protein
MTPNSNSVATAGGLNIDQMLQSLSTQSTQQEAATS